MISTRPILPPRCRTSRSAVPDAQPNPRRPSYLVAYEATESGGDALQLGIALSRLTNADLRICLVLPDSSAVPAKVPANKREFEAVLADRAEAWLAEARDQVPDGLRVHTEALWADSTSDGLLAAARRQDVDRIVVGASRRGLLRRFTVGGVANDLLHASPVPVALAPRGYQAPERITRITCAVGLRAGWQELIDSTAAIAEGLDVDVRFVTLVELGGYAEGSGEDHLQRVLERFTDQESGPRLVTTEVARGDTLEAAVEDLEWREDEVALVGSSRLAESSRVFLGLTANRMLRVLPVPLIVVPTAAV